MKICYYLKKEVTKAQLEKLGFNVIQMLDIKMATRRASKESGMNDLYIPMNENTAFKPFRIYHDSNDTMVKASEIKDLIEAGLVLVGKR